MITITLKRSGGQLGKSLIATHKIDMEEEPIVKQLKAIAPVENPYARDDFSYSITIGGKTFQIDPALLKGSLKKIFSKLEDDLKIDKD